MRGEMDRFGVSMAKLAEAAPGPVQSSQVPAGLKKREDDDGDDMDDVDERPGQTVGEAKAAPAPAPAAAAPTANRWAALRGYISATMEQNPAFAGKN